MGSVTWQFQEERRLKWSLIWIKIYSGDLFHVTCFERQGAHCPDMEQVTESNFMHRQAHARAHLTPSMLGFPRQLELYTPWCFQQLANIVSEFPHWSVNSAVSVPQGLGPSSGHLGHLTFPFCLLQKRWLYHQLPCEVWLTMTVPVTKNYGACERGSYYATVCA